MQPQRVAQVREVGQQRDDAAVVGLEELPQGQDGQQLVLGKVFLGELRGVRRVGVGRDLVRPS